MAVARILIWNLADSKTTLAEVREHVEPSEGVHWISNEAQERFGLIALGDDVSDLARVRDLIGKEPDVAEEFDLEDA